MGGQFHLDATTYLDAVRGEIKDYDQLQAQLATATAGIGARTILDLGSGTGETAKAVLSEHPGAGLVGIDSSDEMLAIARRQLPESTFLVSRLEDPLPDGPFDLVVSAFAIHHLDGPGKLGLFSRVARILSPAGRFAFLDVVIPEAPVSDPILLEPDVDMPSRVDEMMQWLTEAGLRPDIAHSAGDLAILIADAPPIARG
ncbi:MAG: class I SAM-dependent methyltransferase [Acidimicrobiia bacterium]